MPKAFLVTDAGDISDGDHTFGELYEHRYALYIALARQIAARQAGRVWRSKYHANDWPLPDWFLLGIDRDPGAQVTYHLPMRFWEAGDVDFAEELERAPEFDGHSSADVLARLDRL